MTTRATVMLATPATAESHLPDLGGQVVAVVTENAYPLLQFIKSGAAIGWEYDAMAEIARRLKMDVVYESSSWDAMIPAVSERQYDIGMTGITICEDWAEVVDFTDPYITSERVMLVRGDEDRFSDAAIFAADSDLLMAAKPGTTPFYVGVCDVLYGDEANPRIKTMGNLRGHGAGAAHGRR